MTTYFITRHRGALQSAREEGLVVDHQSDHLDAGAIGPQDVIIGTLPVHLAAEVCRRGGRYLHLTLELPPELRGIELSAEQMRQCKARLAEYHIEESKRTPHWK